MYKTFREGKIITPYDPLFASNLYVTLQKKKNEQSSIQILLHPSFYIYISIIQKNAKKHDIPSSHF